MLKNYRRPDIFEYDVHNIKPKNEYTQEEIEQMKQSRLKCLSDLARQGTDINNLLEDGESIEQFIKK